MASPRIDFGVTPLQRSCDGWLISNDRNRTQLRAIRPLPGRFGTSTLPSGLCRSRMNCANEADFKSRKPLRQVAISALTARILESWDEGTRVRHARELDEDFALREMVQDRFEESRISINKHNTNSCHCCRAENVKKSPRDRLRGAQRVIIATLRAWIVFRLDRNGKCRLTPCSERANHGSTKTSETLGT